MPVSTHLVYVGVLEGQVADGEDDAVDGQADGQGPVGLAHGIADLQDAVADDDGGVDHGDLVHQLHLVDQRRVEQRRAHAHHQHRHVAQQEPEND